jgi:hypothetical protein
MEHIHEGLLSQSSLSIVLYVLSVPFLDFCFSTRGKGAFGKRKSNFGCVKSPLKVIPTLLGGGVSRQREV